MLVAVEVQGMQEAKVLVVQAVAVLRLLTQILLLELLIQEVEVAVKIATLTLVVVVVQV
jgi:hypothetical protein